MTKQEFLAELKTALSQRQVQNIDEILADYNEHFEHALAEGKSEADVCQKLGSTSQIAQAYETNSMVSAMKQGERPFTFKFGFEVLVRLIVIAPFNFFMICIPGAVLFSLLIAAWASVVAVFSIGIAIFTAGFQASLASLSAWMGAAVVSTSLFTFCLSIVLAITMGFITKHFILFIINYLQWNLKFILQK